MPTYKPMASSGTPMYAPIANNRSILVYGSINVFPSSVATATRYQPTDCPPPLSTKPCRSARTD